MEGKEKQKQKTVNKNTERSVFVAKTNWQINLVSNCSSFPSGFSLSLRLVFYVRVCSHTCIVYACVCVCVLRCMFINVCSYSNAWNLLVYVKVGEKGKTVSFFQRILFLALSYEEISWPIFLILVTGNLRILYYLIPILALKSRGWLLPFGRWVNWVSERLQSLPKVYSACR